MLKLAFVVILLSGCLTGPAEVHSPTSLGPPQQPPTSVDEPEEQSPASIPQNETLPATGPPPTPIRFTMHHMNAIAATGMGVVNWGDGNSEMVEGSSIHYFQPGNYTIMAENASLNFQATRTLLLERTRMLPGSAACGHIVPVAPVANIDPHSNFGEFIQFPEARDFAILVNSTTSSELQLTQLSRGGTLENETLRIQTNSAVVLPGEWDALVVNACEEMQATIQVWGIHWPQPAIWNESGMQETVSIPLPIDCYGWLGGPERIFGNRYVPTPALSPGTFVALNSSQVEGHPIKILPTDNTQFIRLAWRSELGAEHVDNMWGPIRYFLPDKLEYVHIMACSDDGLETAIELEIYPHTNSHAIALGPEQAFW